MKLIVLEILHLLSTGYCLAFEVFFLVFYVIFFVLDFCCCNVGLCWYVVQWYCI